MSLDQLTRVQAERDELSQALDVSFAQQRESDRRLLEATERESKLREDLGQQRRQLHEERR